MKNLKGLLELSCKEQVFIVGGRHVVKVDIDGDGRWDLKWVQRNNGTIVFRSRIK